MKYSCLTAAVLSLAFVVPLSAQSAPSPEPTSALGVLQRVSQRYADAKSYRIEMVQERTSTGAFHREWAKTFFNAAESGGHLRYEGRGPWSNALRISDGKTEWVYHVDEQRYTKKLAADSDVRSAG